MKRLISVALLTVLVLAPLAHAGDLKTKSVTAQNQWTDPVQVENAAAWGATGTGWVSTVTLQYCIPGNSCSASGTDWVDTGDVLTSAGVYVIPEGAFLYYRVGVKTGGYTSGTVPVWIRGKY